MPQDKKQQADAHCVLENPGPAAASESNPQAGHGCCACCCQSCMTVTVVSGVQEGGYAPGCWCADRETLRCYQRPPPTRMPRDQAHAWKTEGLPLPPGRQGSAGWQ